MCKDTIVTAVQFQQMKKKNVRMKKAEARMITKPRNISYRKLRGRKQLGYLV